MAAVSSGRGGKWLGGSSSLAFVAAVAEAQIRPAALRLTDFDGVRLTPVTHRRRRRPVGHRRVPAARQPTLMIA
jgi:hypothetical protein